MIKPEIGGPCNFYKFYMGGNYQNGNNALFVRFHDHFESNWAIRELKKHTQLTSSNALILLQNESSWSCGWLMVCNKVNILFKGNNYFSQNIDHYLC